MIYTSKLLVIANRTADSAELLDALRTRAERTPIDVTLVAPATPGELAETADARLDRAIEALSDAGIPAAGVRGDPDPMLALADAWDPRRFDEIVVATLPGATSRWQATNLPKRAERFTGVPVLHVVAHPSSRAMISDERREPSLRR